jgi:hypothetical protein
MSKSTTLADLLREQLDDLTPPAGYNELVSRLNKPVRRPPVVKISPQNYRDLGSKIVEQD